MERTIELRNALVSEHWYLCVRAAKKFKRACNERLDLEQVAAIGLIKAADYYRAELSTPFEAYAWVMVVGELMHYVRDHERAIRFPRRLRTLEKRFIAHWDAFTAIHHREPSTVETAEALGVEVAAIEELRLFRRGESVPLSVPSENDGAEVLDLAALPDTFSLEDRVALAWALDRLAERERLIVLGTYSVGLTQSELGERLGLSQSHVSKLLARALGKLNRSVA